MRRTSARIREWWPAIVIIGLALVSVQVLRSSYERWQDVIEQTVSGVDNVSESRRRLLRAYLIEEGKASGNPTFGRASALAEAATAADALSNWFRGRSMIGGLEAAEPTDPGVVGLGRGYQRALEAFHEALAARPPDAVERRRAFSIADQRAAALESAVHQDLRSTLAAERRRSTLRLAGWGLVLLFTGLGLVYARVAQRRAEQERERSDSRLFRLRALAPVGIIECDPEGRVRATNRMWCEMTGRSDEDWLGRPWWEALAPSEHDRARAIWSASVGSGEEGMGEFLLDAAGTGGDAEWVLTRTAPESGDLADPDRWAVTFTDITSRRHVEEQLRHAQKMEAVGRLAGGVAHDFNNLLTSIGGFATLAREAAAPGDPVREDLLEIERGAGRGRALTRQLLTFSRQERIRPEPLDVRVVARDLEKMLVRLVREDIELRLVVGDEPATVLADRGQIDQVLTNLVVNAGDAMPDGGRIRIGVSTAHVTEPLAAARSDIPPGRYALLSVADTGSGIPESARDRIFEPFYTTKERGKGTGLGLSTVWGIVRQSGGHVHLYSETGRGTVFKIYLPVLDGVDQAAAVEAPSRPEATASHGGTILVVEDQEAVRRLATRVLQLRGFTVLEASDGHEALKTAEAHPRIDLLITDVVMRGMGGLELRDRLRERGRTLPILFMSGYSDTEIPIADAAFLEKPFSPDDLARKVAEVLSR